MKTTYHKPSIDVVRLTGRQHLLAGSSDGMPTQSGDNLNWGDPSGSFGEDDEIA